MIFEQLRKHYRQFRLRHSTNPNSTATSSIIIVQNSILNNTEPPGQIQMYDMLYSIKRDIDKTNLSQQKIADKLSAFKTELDKTNQRVEMLAEIKGECNKDLERLSKWSHLHS